MQQCKSVYQVYCYIYIHILIYYKLFSLSQKLIILSKNEMQSIAGNIFGDILRTVSMLVIESKLIILHTYYNSLMGLI